MKHRWIWIGLMMVLLTAVCLASASPAAAADPTPTPPAQGGQAGGGVSFIGLLILLAPAIWMVYKASSQRKIDIKAASCLPVVDEDKGIK